MIQDLTAPNSPLSMTGIDYSGQQVALSNSDLSSSPAPSPDPRTNRKPGRPVNPLPRHKRDSHINAEHRRRNKIKKGFETLKTLVPALQDSPSLKESKSSMLFKTVEHCRQIQAACKAQQDEACALQQELVSLNEDIEKLQAQLPDSGVDRVQPPRATLKDMFEEYVTKRTKENVKFLFFSYLIRPLFESYNKMVNTETMQIFHDAVYHWRDVILSLTNLRQGSLTAMLQISTQTSIMDKPQDVPKEANKDIVQPSPSLDKTYAPIPVEHLPEKNTASVFSSIPMLKSSPSSSASNYVHYLPKTSASFSSSSSSATFSSSSSFSNPSNNASSSTSFLVPDQVDNLMVGASAASTASNVDLSFLDRYSSSYNDPIMDNPNLDNMSIQNQTHNIIEPDYLWEDVKEFILFTDNSTKDKSEYASSQTFDLSSFDLTKFSNSYGLFPDNQTETAAANNVKNLPPNFKHM